MMDTFDDSLEDVNLTIGGRRKRKDKATHKKEIVKRARYSSGGKIPAIACSHNDNAECKGCLAANLTPSDLALNQEKFYDSLNKVRSAF